MWATEVTSNDSHAVPGVKPHPRERNESFLASIASIDFRAVALPHQMPAELMASRLSKDCVIRSSLSTFVVTSRFLIPGRKIELESVPAKGAFEKLTAWDSGISK